MGELSPPARHGAYQFLAADRGHRSGVGGQPAGEAQRPNSVPAAVVTREDNVPTLPDPESYRTATRSGCDGWAAWMAPPQGTSL